MLVRLLLSIRSLEEVQRALAEHRGSDEPLVAGFANVGSAQFSENAGDIEAAARYGLAAYESAKRSGDSWLTGTAAQSLAQFYSQRARPVEALDWADRAVPALRALEAEDDLRQLDWLVALNQVASGRINEARGTLERLAEADPESAGFDFADLRSIGLGGLAEIAASEGKPREARRLFARARDVYQESRRRGAPWSLTVTSGYIVTSVRAGEANDPETIASLRKLRTQIFVGRRIRPQFSDRPVLGSAVLGVAVWLLAPGRTGATEAEHAAGFELLILAHALAGREDLPTLNWAVARAEVELAYPGTDLDTLADAVHTLTMDEREARAFTVLRNSAIRDALTAD
jgi:tetratricopeptide (TPR) repeat protein